ncbi:HlyD family efflux transporter periplasmic adaptor subunit [Microcoleus sp. LEGE 07076]|uniref:HlyD family efflux transporter periplasmic adaptor subunit n=1 Tax=Microcoleus sp. LEGE 07076 TaxID=915322 RepID=UPI00187E62E2|nr:HlyD family efflux transporter periplasmic adaptor subunit [Microcoleus sp. LEGE 07076]MBE9184952.1 HlyD family efflux transporter periplasmic adaptor subunit [Microcoleus sp. LEGE 07076]
MFSEDVKELGRAADEIGEVYGGVASRSEKEDRKKDRSLEVVPSQNRSFQTNEAITIAKFQQPDADNWSASLHSVLDQPPVSFSQRLILGGLVFCVAFGAWATLGKIDVVGHAKGKLVPKGDVYKIHPTETGKIINLAIKEGQKIKTGQLLAELDPSTAQSEVERLDQILGAYRIQLVQEMSAIDRTKLEAEASQAIAAADKRGAEAAIARARASSATTQSQIEQLQADVVSQKARHSQLKPLEKQAQNLLSQLKSDVTSGEARRDRVKPLQNKSQDLVTQLQAKVAAHKERIARLKPLVDEGALSKDVLFQAEEALRESENAVIRSQLGEKTQADDRVFEVEQTVRDRQSAAIRSQLSEATQVKERLFEVEQGLRDRTSSIGKMQGQLTEQLAEVDRLQAEAASKQAAGRQMQLEKQQKIQQLEMELNQVKSKIAETETLLAQAKNKLKQRFLYAPVSGVISALNIHNSGEVVQPGQTIAEMTPNQAPLVLEVSLPNREAGFVKTGMPVQVKFDAFPYQNYGVMPGKVVSISPDAKTDERLGVVYRVEVSMDRDSVKANNQTWKLKAGQTATAEIVIRQRSIADILLDPLKQLQKGGMSL